MTRPSGSAIALLRRFGLRAAGPVRWGEPPLTRAPGIYIVELPGKLPVAPLDPTVIARWRRRVPTMTVDGASATVPSLSDRLASFWIPSASVLYIGQASGTVRGRVGDYYSTPLGDRRPHAGGHWIKTLDCLADCLVWSSATDDYDAAERELLDEFARTVPPPERRALHDPWLVLPFANLQDGRRVRKRHGIGGARIR
jgi:hypothetical protein